MNNKSFFKAWKKLAHTQVNPLTKHTGDLNLLHNKGFIQLMERAPCVVFVMNHATSRYDFFSKNALQFFGYTSDEMIEGGIPFGMSLIDPIQRENHSRYTMPAMFEYLKIFGEKGELKKIQISFNLRFRRKNGEWRWGLQHVTVLETDETGGPLLSLAFMSDITDIKKDEQLDFSVAKLNSENYFQSFFTTSFPFSKEIILSPREWEIVSLLNAGKTSEEIASQLSLSIHTVRTHRRNILEKMEAKNTSHLLDICRRKGIV